MKIAMDGFQENIVTMEAADGVAKGNVVKITADLKVEQCADGDDICGVVVSVAEGYAAVQLKGFATIKSSGAIGYGYQELAAAGADSVKALEGGRKLLVVQKDTSANTISVIL